MGNIITANPAFELAAEITAAIAWDNDVYGEDVEEELARAFHDKQGMIPNFDSIASTLKRRSDWTPEIESAFIKRVAEIMDEDMMEDDD